MKQSLLRTLPFAAATAVSLSTSAAFACGGLFCNNSNPVNQAAERIIFAMDGENVTQIVEIMYEGPGEEFSWVLPVPGRPTPGVSSVQAFDRLQAATNPQYRLASQFDETCDFASSGDGDGDSAGDGDGDGDGDGPTVTVIDAGSVGPFNFETISVDAADEDPGDVAVAWLEDNGYDAGPRAKEVLGPYLQNGLNLIAFKLKKGLDAGAIRPVSLQYKAKSAAIPILPTAVAAANDMPILVWVLGDHRAVSTNYKSLELNEALINWFNPGPTYNDVVSAAADEAEGQGFVTELAGPTEDLSGVVLRNWDTQSFESAVEQVELEAMLTRMTTAFAIYDGYREAVAEHVVLRDGFSVDDFLSCPYCYFHPGTAGDFGLGGAPGEYDETPIPDTDPIFESDREAFTTAVDEEVLGPIAAVEELFATHPWVTRLYTTMSPGEMTLDPVFEFNPDLEEVSNVHTADWLRSCENDDWTVVLEDGQRVPGSGNSWPNEAGDDGLPANVRILQYGTSGPGEVLVDNSGDLMSRFGPDTESGSGSARKKDGGCAWQGPPADPSRYAFLFSLLVAGAWFLRRPAR